MTVMIKPDHLYALHGHPDYVRIPLNGPYMTLEPGINSDILSMDIQTQLFLGLTRFEPETLNVIPYLATHWKTLKGMKEYIFYLRKDARWTDGEPVTAHDVAWTIRRNITPERKSELAYMLFVLQNAEKIYSGEIHNLTQLGVHVIDDHTLVFTLEHPAAYFPAMTAYTPFWPLPKKTVLEHGKEWTNPENIVTNGAYRLREVWEKEKVTILEKNPFYHDFENVGIREIHYKVVKPQDALGLYRENEIDILGGEYLPIHSQDFSQILADSQLTAQLLHQPRLCVYYYGFDNKTPPTDNPLVRKAISMAIDKNALIRDAAGGRQEPAYTFTRPPIFGSVDPSENIGIKFDPEHSRNLLSQAGYPDGKGLTELVLIHNSDNLHKNIASNIARQLKNNLNINLIVRDIEWDSYYKMLTSNEYQANMFRWGWCADYPDANNWLMENFHPTRSSNLIHWQNETFASLVERAAKITDPFARKTFYKKAEKILCETEAAIIPLFYDSSRILVKPWLNVKIWPLMGNHIQTWSFKDTP